jgi:hypothetical protein
LKIRLNTFFISEHIFENRYRWPGCLEEKE